MQGIAAVSSGGLHTYVRLNFLYLSHKESQENSWTSFNLDPWSEETKTRLRPLE